MITTCANLTLVTCTFILIITVQEGKGKKFSHVCPLTSLLDHHIYINQSSAILGYLGPSVQLPNVLIWTLFSFILIQPVKAPGLIIDQ